MNRSYCTIRYEYAPSTIEVAENEATGRSCGLKTTIQMRGENSLQQRIVSLKNRGINPLELR